MPGPRGVHIGAAAKFVRSTPGRALDASRPGSGHARDRDDVPNYTSIGTRTEPGGLPKVSAEVRLVGEPRVGRYARQVVGMHRNTVRRSFETKPPKLVTEAMPVPPTDASSQVNGMHAGVSSHVRDGHPGMPLRPEPHDRVGQPRRRRLASSLLASRADRGQEVDDVRVISREGVSGVRTIAVDEAEKRRDRGEVVAPRPLHNAPRILDELGQSSFRKRELRDRRSSGPELVRVAQSAIFHDDAQCTGVLRRASHGLGDRAAQNDTDLHAFVVVRGLTSRRGILGGAEAQRLRHCLLTRRGTAWILATGSPNCSQFKERMRRSINFALTAAGLVVPFGTGLSAQIDKDRANAYFKEAEELCAKDGGKLLGVSLCGPMAFADPRTRDVVGNEPLPTAPRPPALGFANAALRWGEKRWSVFVWPFIPANDPRARKTLLMHELVHRVQPELGLFGTDANNDHLDTVDGRYWIQLEWRALAAALRMTGDAMRAPMSHALAFRRKRHELFAAAQEAERALEINEGIPQFVATLIVNDSLADAVAHAVAQLDAAPRTNATLVRTFPYPAGVAYGVLLEMHSPSWTRRVKVTDDLAMMLATAARVQPASEPDAIASQYGATELRAAEVRRDEERKARVAELRRRFVEGPVVILPNGTQNSFVTNGMTPIPDAGMVYPTFRTSGEWGSAEAELILMSSDRTRLTLPGPTKIDGSTATGAGWTVKMASGWSMRPGTRNGDMQLVKVPPRSPR